MLGVADLVERLRPLVGHLAGPPRRSDVVPSLPEAHVDLLRALNGFTVQQGALRIFGLGRGDELDLRWWNSERTWRFAWDDRADPFLFFGTTAWGDQYAYRRGADGTLEPTVFFVEGVMLREQPIAASFEEFAASELLRVADAPYDSMTVGALERYGPIEPDQLWTLVPPLSLGGEESLDNVTVLPAETAMVFAGDIASGLAARSDGQWPTRVVPWVDNEGRERLRLGFD